MATLRPSSHPLHADPGSDPAAPSMLVKAFRLIEVLAGQRRGRSLAELASTAGLPKPTAHRLLKMLCDMGYVERGEGGVYRLGYRFARITLGREHERLVAVASPVLDRMHDLCQETVNLGVLQQGQVVYLWVHECTYPLRRVATPNESHAFYGTALGRAIAAQLPSDELEAMIASTEFEQRTPHTVTDPRRLRELLAQARAQGYAIEEGETDLGVMCIGAPVFSRARVLGAISVSVPTARVGESDRKQLIELVRETAARITDMLRKKGNLG